MSILIQLHTGHISLNIFLKKIKAVDSPLCACCQQPETVAHFLKYCKCFAGQCNQLRHEVGKVLRNDLLEANDGVAKSDGGDVGGTWLQLMCCTLPKCLCP